MQKALILGLGVSGKSAVKCLLKEGYEVTALDQKDLKLEQDCEIKDLCSQGVIFLNEEETLDLTSFDFLVVSPGISPKNPIYNRAKALNKEILGEIELGCRLCKSSMIGVTGTNGKTTVTLLLEHVLKSAGKKAHALGNLGVPFSSKAKNFQKEEIAILELSSFQLETMKKKSLDAGVILNITPDHLDRYENIFEYAKAKINLSKCLKDPCALLIEEKSYQIFKDLLFGVDCQLYGYTPSCDIFTDLQFIYFNKGEKFPLPQNLVGKKSHDLENYMAAFAICRKFDVSSENFHHAFTTFSKPHHRIEFIREFQGVRYFDDSKGTNIDAVIRAVESLEGKILLIAGGVDKGSSYAPWLKVFADKVSCIIAIGQAKEKIQTELSSFFPVVLEESLQSAVLYAASIAKPKENVLLSPGCSSYDMFRNYAHRGEEFQRIVNSLGV